MIVVDTSAIVGSLLSGSNREVLQARFRADGDLHAPYLIDIEFAHALRRMVLIRHTLSEDLAMIARAEFASMRIERHAHQPLMDRIWALRANLTAYDATFIALAESLRVPLITADAPMARAPGNNAHIELFYEP